MRKILRKIYKNENWFKFEKLNELHVFDSRELGFNPFMQYANLFLKEIKQKSDLGITKNTTGVLTIDGKF